MHRLSQKKRALFIRIRRIFILPFPFWRALARLYTPAPDTTFKKILNTVLFSPLWKLVNPNIYDSKSRDRMFEFIYAYFYHFKFKSGQTILQVGANTGGATMRFAKAVGDRGKVIAIEADPGNFSALEKRIKQHSLTNVKPVLKGAWSRKGVVQFLMRESKAHRIAELPGSDIRYTDRNGNDIDINEDYYDKVATLSVDTVDGILRDNKLSEEVFDYAIIETNGAELEVLKGMNQTIEKISELEIRAHVNLDGMPINRDITTFLKKKGFTTSIDADGDVRASRSSARG